MSPTRPRPAAPAVMTAIGARRALRAGKMVEAALAVVVASGTNTVNNVVAIGTIGKGVECRLFPLSDHLVTSRRSRGVFQLLML